MAIIKGGNSQKSSSEKSDWQFKTKQKKKKQKQKSHCLNKAKGLTFQIDLSVKHVDIVAKMALFFFSGAA